MRESLAANLARHRAVRGWSLARLSAASGVSRAMLNQIERRQSVPTIGILWKIATALETPFSALLEAQPPLSTTVLEGRRAWALTSPDGGFVSRALFPLAGPRRTEFYELSLAPEVLERADPHPPGTSENLVVNRGRIRIEVGDNHYALDQGDAIEFRADVAHSYENPGPEPALAYLVMSYEVRIDPMVDR